MSSINSKPALWALVDCESFYASCERLFRPDLMGQPVVVLSNNDGCLVSMTPEAKALGFRNGEPFFQVADRLKKAGAAVFSSNYTLYADLSRRVLTTMASLVPEVAQYSIDEAFVPFDTALAAQADSVGWALHDRVKQWTGIPVRVGIGPTKTLAKLANRWAKKMTRVLRLELGSEQLEKILPMTPVGDIWGIGRRLAARLEQRGITNALQMRNLGVKEAKKLFNVLGQRTILELQGIQCVEEEALSARKTLFNSRSFGRPVTTKEELKEALAYHCSIAGERLRAEGMTAASLSIYLATSWHIEDAFQTGATMNLATATDDTLIFIRAANEALEQCFKPGPKYMKAGILLLDLGERDRQNVGLFEPVQDERSQKLMSALDEINAKFGRGTARFAAQGEPDASWHMKRNLKSGHLTTKWEELPTVKT
jgi:DNA polymerase V